ncbi:MAG: hypothetical protein Q4C45_01230, partial [Oscillospiraceae bacterium]|nr:hypothetical protein [Oscillospiraceae bacterium]
MTVLNLLAGAAWASDENGPDLTVSVTEVGETEATLTVVSNVETSGNKFAVYKVQEKGESAPADATGFTDFLYTWNDNSTTATLTGLKAGTEYVVYAAIAYFVNGNSTYSEMVSEEFTTAEKAAELAVSVTEVGETEATLTVVSNVETSGNKFA